MLPLAPSATDPASDTPAALCGSLEVVPIFDVIQWVCGAGQSWLVRVWAEEGLDAAVAIVDGELVHAQCGNKTGYDALIVLLEAKTGRFELQTISGDLQRTLRGNWMETLLTAAQKADEAPAAMRERRTATRARTRSSDSGEYALTSPGLRTVPAPPAPESSHLIDLGFAAMKSGDIERARLLWTQALEHDPGNRALQFNLRKLDSLRPPTR